LIYKDYKVIKDIVNLIGGHMNTKLKLLRIEKSLTQREVGRVLGINPVVLSKIENSWLRPNLKQVVKLSRFYGVTERDLIEDLLKEIGK
jgi:transcriptional regulator with XRE-family HTH domain